MNTATKIAGVAIGAISLASVPFFTGGSQVIDESEFYTGSIETDEDKYITCEEEQVCEDLMDDLSVNSKLGGEGQVSLRITNVNKHTTQDIWFFSLFDSRDPNSVDGNLASNNVLIQSCIDDTDCAEIEKTNQELIDEGYLPEPETI